MKRKPGSPRRQVRVRDYAAEYRRRVERRAEERVRLVELRKEMVRGRAKKAARSSARSVVAKKGAVTRKLREARRRFFPDTYHGRDLRSRHVLSAFIADSSPEYLEFLQSVENIVSFDIAKNWWMSPKVGAR